MAGSPKYKAYRGKEFVASFKYPEDAAVLISADVIDRITYDRAVWVWTEKDDSAIAANSYDDAAELMTSRLRMHNIKKARSLGYTDAQIINELNHDPAEVAAA